jgi:hypothetical protein
MLLRASLAGAPALEAVHPDARIALGWIAPAWIAPDWVSPDWIAIGLVLSILGAFLLGNAILFRHPRTLVGEFFGSRTGARGVRLHAIREYVFHRAQVAVGFTYLVGGFGLELLGRYRSTPPEAGAPTAQPTFPAAWVGAILVLTIALLALAWWWARHSFRRHVRGHLRREPPEFESDLRLAREVGDLFGVESQDDDTVQSYLERLHRAIDLPPPEPRGRREIPLPRMEELEAEENV